jgi:RNA polymerase sigma-70 factor (ECF subfamily)
VLATLIRLVGDFELAQDALQEAFAAALEQWDLPPPNPRAWLVAVGRNKAIDRIRRRVRFDQKVTDLDLPVATEPVEPDAFGDDLLRLIFTCCHPALNLEAQVALTLRAVCGLGTEAVARAFLVREETMAQRLVRAQTKIREAKIPYETPAARVLDERVDGVLSAVYLVFNEGYAPTSGASLRQDDLTQQAIRLGRLLDELLPGRPAVQGLLALMLLHDARRDARTDDAGDLVLLEQQDRARWDHAQIAEGAMLVDRALRVPGRPASYAVQAAIAALHATAPSADKTDWPQIVGLYGVLLRLHPSPVVELNHAAAVAMVDGPQRALDLLDALAARGGLDANHLLPAARADMLRRLGQIDAAVAAYLQAEALAKVEPERRWIQARIRALREMR